MTDRVRVQHREGGRMLTVQSARDQANVNKIMERWVHHGQIPLGREGARYGDFRSSLDYHEALNRVRRAEEEFNRLPAHVRDHVDNDPGAFLAMAFDPERRSELVELGLLEEELPEVVPGQVAGGAGDPDPPEGGRSGEDAPSA